MKWLHDPAWRQGMAILLVIGGAVLIYLNSAEEGDLGRGGVFGFMVFGSGVALPLIFEFLRAHRQSTARSEDV